MGRHVRGLAAAAALMGLALAGCGPDPGALPRLPVGASGSAGATDEAGAIRSAGGAADALRPAGGAADAMVMPYARVEYRLGAPLPELPASAAAYELGAGVDRGSVERLARALGLDGRAEPVDGSGWVVVDGDKRLSAAGFGGGPWFFGGDSAVVASTCVVPDRPAEEVASKEMYGGCSAPPPVDLPSEAEATGLARGFFERAGIDIEGALMRSHELESQGWQVSLQPLVDGVPVVGLEHSVVIGSGGEVLWANGFLSRPEKVGEYPLVGTAKGFERLVAGFGGGYGDPRPLAGAPEPAIARDPACGPSAGPCDLALPEMPEVVVQSVTGVELVLMAVPGRCGGDPGHLVPAYRFVVGDGSFVAPVPAVVDSHLDRSTAAGEGSEVHPCGPLDGTEPVRPPGATEEPVRPPGGEDEPAGPAGEPGSTGGGSGSVEPAPGEGRTAGPKPDFPAYGGDGRPPRAP